MNLSYTDIITGQRCQITATITTDHPDSSYGQPVIVLSDGSPLDVTSWILLNYHITQATELEYTLLRKWLSTASFYATGGSHYDMTVAEAVAQAAKAGTTITDRAVRLAAENGYIPGAYKLGRDWLIPNDGFFHYLENRPKPGPKPHKETPMLTRDDIDKLFGPEATDDTLLDIATNWVRADIVNYLTQTGYTADPDQVIAWLRKFAQDN